MRPEPAPGQRAPTARVQRLVEQAELPGLELLSPELVPPELPPLRLTVAQALRQGWLGRDPMRSRPPTLRRMAMLPLGRLFQMPVHRLPAQRHPPESPD